MEMRHRYRPLPTDGVRVEDVTPSPWIRPLGRNHSKVGSLYAFVMRAKTLQIDIKAFLNDWRIGQPSKSVENNVNVADALFLLLTTETPVRLINCDYVVPNPIIQGVNANTPENTGIV